VKIALAQINPTVGDFQANADKILSFIDKSKQQHADLVIFPELSLVGYPPLDLLEKDHFVQDNIKCLNQLVKKIKGISALIGYVDKNTKKHGKPYHNAAAFISDGNIVSKHFKTLLPSYDVFDETRHFEPASKLKKTSLKKHKFAISICEDIWNDKDFWQRRMYAKDPLASLFKHNSTCLINISASPFALDKQQTRVKMLSAIAKKYKVPTIYVNQVGSNDELIFDGSSFVMNKNGEIIAQCRDFEEDLLIVDMEKMSGIKHPTSKSNIEAIHHALVLGVKDYAAKCGFKKALIGLSGGIDSAVTAALAVDALGSENVICVMMPSRYNAKESLTDAEALAKNLEIRTETLSIEPMFKAFLETLNPFFKGQNSDLAEQNLQARIRGNLLMALSNLWHALVLSTGNKSEVATGYCTLYGDMTGGLAVLSDVPKTIVYKLAHHLNHKKIVIPENIITKAPSAELKPNQTDQDTLPAYEKLDRIIAAYIEEQKSTADMMNMGFSKKMLGDIIQRIDRNEYKRRQAPPGLRITHKAFGIGRRFPIVQRYKEFSN